MSSLPPDRDVPWDRLARLVAGELSAEEAAHLSRWLAAQPDRQRLIAEVYAVWAVTTPGAPSRDAEQVLAAIRRREASQIRVLPAHPRLTTAVSASGRRVLRRALAAAAIAGIALGGWRASRETRLFGRPPTSVAFVEHRTARGQRLTVTLPDGSTAMLAPESILRYAFASGRGTRTVELAGEGYFDVVHDAAHPFVVRAGNAIARDLGTRFAVRARPESGTVEVGVAQGRVALSGADQPLSEAVVLDSGGVGRVGGAGLAMVAPGTSLDPYLGWTEGRLVFDATPLAGVAAQLSRWYNVEVTVADTEIMQRRVTGDFRNEPVSKVLSMVQASLGLELRVNGRQYILSAR